LTAVTIAKTDEPQGNENGATISVDIGTVHIVDETTNDGTSEQPVVT
jgi:hypothetical protein